MLNNKLLPDRIYDVDGFKYTTDAQGRVKKIEAEITYAQPPHRRDGVEQGRAKDVKNGRTDPPVDQGGHMVGARFNGPVEQINYFPQNAGLNQGAWKSMEDEWAAISQGTNTTLGVPPIRVEIYPFFEDAARPLRPSRFEVKSWYNNVEQPLRPFANPF